MHAWTLETAVAFIRKVEPELKEKYNYFLGLTGGVLRKGYSDKDLDIICIPLNGDKPSDYYGAVKYFENLLGRNYLPGFVSGNAKRPKQTIQPLTFYSFPEQKIDIIFQL